MSEFIEDDDATIEGLQRSIYHLNEEKNKGLNKGSWVKNPTFKKNFLHRMVVVGKVNPDLFDNKEAVGQHYENLFKKYQESEPITGILLIYPYHVIHILESSLDHLRAFVEELDQQEKLHSNADDTSTSNGSAPTLGGGGGGGGEQPASTTEVSSAAPCWVVSQSRILIVSYDIPQRLYALWNHRVLDMEPANLELYEPGDTDEKIITDLLNQVTKLGAYLAKEPNKNIPPGEFVMEIFQIKLNEVLNKLRDNVPHLIPQQVVVGYLSCVSESPCAICPSSYLAKYNTPYDSVLASELTWPIPEKMFPYH